MKPNSWKTCIRYIEADAYRYLEHIPNLWGGVKLYYTTPGFKYTVWMRICSYLKQRKRYAFPLYLYAKWRLRACRFRFGIQIPESTVIGEGFYIGHFGSIVVNPKAVIGKNVNISQDVTIGQANRGSRKGTAIIGDCVYIGPGAKIVGAVCIGNNVAIGANAVVTRDIPDNAVVAGVPARIISMNGAEAYVENKYDSEYADR